MITTVFFVRHAEPDCRNHDDFSRELSAKGLKDRKLVTEFLSDKSIDIVLSSPFRRAVDTLADFARKKGLEIQIAENFKERILSFFTLWGRVAGACFLSRNVV